MFSLFFLSVSRDGFCFLGQKEGVGHSLTFISHVINDKLSEGVEMITPLKTRDV